MPLWSFPAGCIQSVIAGCDIDGSTGDLHILSFDSFITRFDRNFSAVYMICLIRMHAVISGTECVSSAADGHIAVGMQTVIAGIYRKGSIFYQQIATGLDSLGAGIFSTGIFSTGVFGIAILCFTSGSCIFGSCASSSFTVSLCTAFFRSGLFHTGSLTGFLRTAVRSTVLHIAAFLICCSRILRWLENRMDGSDNYDLATTDTLAHTSGMYRYEEKKKEED